MKKKNTILVVDDLEIIRASLRSIFEDSYEIIEAENGEDALAIIEKESVSLVLLDLYMPGINGIEVLKRIRLDTKTEDLPVVLITASEDTQQQIDAFQAGANDYIVKPFIPEIAKHRVNNALASNMRMIKVLEDRQRLKRKAELDLLTELYNKITAEEKIENHLKKYPEKQHALLLFDIDNFKQVNDLDGHLVGDHTLKIVADLISSHFRGEDIIGRVGGDEFVAFMGNLSSEKSVIRKADDLVRLLRYKPNLTIPANVTFSIGIAFTDKRYISYKELFARADQSLYQVKAEGKDNYHIYTPEC